MGARPACCLTGVMSLIIRDVDSLSETEALQYLAACDGDEVSAATRLAADRCKLARVASPPDEADVHHAMFLLRKARGLPSQSFDNLRIELRARRKAA